MKTRKMKGIEPIIAVVILIAITLVIAIGVIGWIMGWWGTLGAVESLVIHPDSKLYGNGTIVLHIENKGSAAAVIYKVEVVGVGTNLTDTDLAPGTNKTITVTVNGTYILGANYLVKVYTKAGNVYSITLKAEKKPE